MLGGDWGPRRTPWEGDEIKHCFKLHSRVAFRTSRRSAETGIGLSSQECLPRARPLRTSHLAPMAAATPAACSRTRGPLRQDGSLRLVSLPSWLSSEFEFQMSPSTGRTSIGVGPWWQRSLCMRALALQEHPSGEEVGINCE